jgi:hypothetical protein
MEKDSSDGELNSATGPPVSGRDRDQADEDNYSSYS